jgi:hypothetical protein
MLTKVLVQGRFLLTGKGKIRRSIDVSSTRNFNGIKFLQLETSNNAHHKRADASIHPMRRVARRLYHELC